MSTRASLGARARTSPCTMTELDPIDLPLLALLQHDASRSNLALAEGLVSEFICAAGAALRSVRHGSRPQKRPSVTDRSRAGCKCYAGTMAAPRARATVRNLASKHVGPASAKALLASMQLRGKLACTTRRADVSRA